MQRIGERLKAARLSLGVSLQTLQQRTKVSRRYLEAIENGHYDAIPGEVYLKGFIRSYARAVGLDPEELLDAYYEACADEVRADELRTKGRLARVRRALWSGPVRSTDRVDG